VQFDAEGLVFGIRTVRSAMELKNAQCPHEEETVRAEVTPTEYSNEELEAVRTQVQEIMWRHVGLVRDGEGLANALEELQKLHERFEHPQPAREAVEVANMIQSALLVTTAASEREESRGAHYRLDFPETDDENWQRHLVLIEGKNNIEIS
jgi:L-aspartate oxidase